MGNNILFYLFNQQNPKGYIMLISFAQLIRLTIKMSGNESQPRKIELASTHKNATTTMSILHITTEPVNTLTK